MRGHTGRSIMKKRTNRFWSLLLVMAVSFTMAFGSVGFASAATAGETKAAFTKTGDYLYRNVTEPSYGSVGGEWVIFGLGSAGYDMGDAYLAAYQKTVESRLTEGYRGTPGILQDRAITDYCRVIMAYTAAGLDVTDVAGYDLLEPFAGKERALWQNMNGPIWVLTALDAGKYEIPKLAEGAEFSGKAATQNTRQAVINYIVANQLDDGGWDVSPKASARVSTIDMTCMALYALAPYAKQTKVKKAIDRGLQNLSDYQTANGGFLYTGKGGDYTSESCAWAIMALTANGINPNTDKRFIKNSNSVVDALLSFYDAEVGGFRHVNKASGSYEATVNQMSTEQAYYALAQYYKNVPTQTSLTKAAKAGSGKVKVSWKKATVNTDYVTKKSGKTAGVSGYQIVLATDKKFSKNVKKVTVSGTKTLTKTVTGLKKGKTYYVKVRAYKTVNGKKLYGAYSAAKSVKC